mgnify:CR=1 FL=1
MQGTILIIDGVATNRIMLKVQLSSAYYQVAQTDGIQGLLSVARRCRPDLVLTAMSLPDGTAADVRAELARDEDLADVPVIAISAQNDNAGRLAALAAGIDDVLQQPLDDVILQARIRSLIRTRSTNEELHLQREASQVFDLPFADRITQAQIDGWRKVTDAVHAEDGVIFAQLWHVGRVSHHALQPDGAAPVAPSAIRAENAKAFIQTGPGTGELVAPSLPRALSIAEIETLVGLYATAARNAIAAGFDGVEIHAANGYLVNQFISEHSNQRDDQYGGSLENRARLLLEVTDAVVEVWGAGRVGVHLAPRADAHDMGDDNLAETFTYVASELGKRGIAFICARERELDDSLAPRLKQAFGGAFIANEKFTKATANEWLASGKADAVAFGVPFIANPDLPARLAKDAPLNEPHPETFYAKGAEGYLDYPTL